jgi:hypothetical protein
VSSKPIKGLLAACWLVASASGCTGPGLEPPWSDDGEGRSSSNGAGMAPPTTVAPPGSGTGEFGNPIGSAGSGSAPTAGTSAAPSTPDPTTPPPVAGSAGAGAVTPPPTTPSDGAGDGGASDPGQLPSGEDALHATDFVPDCDSELATALTSAEACRYPLTGDPASVRVATLDADVPMLLTEGQSMLSCLFGSDYYVDATVTPAVIVLCSQICSALPSTAQVVAVEGCVKAP